MFYLLDVNVLIALADPSHQFHAAFNRWFIKNNRPVLATCPLTENGFLRIYGHPDYPGGPGSPHLAMIPLLALRNRSDSVFLPDDYSLAESSSGISLYRATPRQLTDLYLVGLARRHKGRLATFDRNIRLDAIEQGRSFVEVIS